MYGCNTKNLMARISICESMLSCNKIWWWNVDQRQEKIGRGQDWQSRLFCYVFVWGWRGLINCALLTIRQTLNSELYCQQLQYLKEQSPSFGQKGSNCVLSGQHQATHFVSESSEDSVGCFAFTFYFGPAACFWLLPFPVNCECFNCWKFRLKWSLWK